jgi:pyruvate kinase
MKKNIEIFCTLGPSSINKSFLKFAKYKISLLRLNMSHTNIETLKENIIFIKKNSNIPICIDTEGAQIRIKTKIAKFFKINQKFKIFKKNNSINLYPHDVYDKLNIRDILNIGFDDLKANVISKNLKFMTLKVFSAGRLENNKGVHVENRSVKLDFLTKKDLQAIEAGKKLNIKNFALSFTNSVSDIIKFNKILPTQRKIFKLESKQAIETFHMIIKVGNNFLIDRGDLSKEILIENIPYIQRKILKTAKKFKNKNIYIATNFLESMIENKFPTRGEANDIYNSLETGAKGLVLAAETAIGHYPKEAVTFLRKMILVYQKFTQ